MIHAPRDELDLIELQRPHSTRMTFQTMQLYPSLEIPYSHSAIVRTRDEDRELWMRQGLAELQTHDAIAVAFQCADGAPTSPPVSLDGESFTVYIFPRTSDGIRHGKGGVWS